MKNSNETLKRNYTIEDLEQILDSIPYEVYLKKLDGTYKYVNKEAADKVGLTKEEIIGKTDYDFRTSEMANICTDGDKLTLKRGKATFVEDKLVDGNIETAYELFKTILYDSITKEKIICGIGKFVINDKSVSNYIIKKCTDIMNSSKIIDIYVVYNEILGKLKKTTEADDVALYLYDKSLNTMDLDIHIGNNKKKFQDKYVINDIIRKEYHENNDCIIVNDLGNNAIKYIYLLKNNNKLLGSMHIYYKHKPIDIKEEFVKYVCLLLSFMQNENILTDNLNKELQMRRESQEKLQMMIDSAVDYYALAKRDGDKTIWLETSKGFNKTIGWTVDDLNSRNYIELVHPKDRNKVISTLSKYYKKNCKVSFEVLCKDGNWITVEANLYYLADNIYMIAANDISVITELKKDKEELQHIVELEGLKAEFFANISHEFKTPLNIILSTVQVIANFMITNQRYPDCDKFYRYINNIKQNSYRLLKLANNMIDITKIDGGFYEINMGNNNIVEVVENIVQSVVVYMKDNKRSIIFDTAEEEIITACDPSQIERIILNILSNAMKFTSPGGHIYVNIDVSDECNKLIIRINNDGEPLNAEDSKRIFDRFTQSEQLLTRKSEGSGIGLSLVKSLVEMHKGIIYVNTGVKEGTEFCIELPIRKIMNTASNHVWQKSLNSKVERFDIEFSDIYN